MAKPAPLPKRFQPLLNQANTEAALRYGSQESGLASLLGQLTHNYQQQSQAQNTMGQSLLGSLKGADQRLQGVYSDAGLTPSLLAGIANSPTGQRLAGELAQGRGDIQSQMLGAQAGQQYIQGHLADQYRQDVGQVSDQTQALLKERGLFTQSQLDTLISGDRSARHDANVAAAKQSHDDLQAQLQRQSSLGDALIGQGLAPVLGKDGSVTIGAPLPGGKADPNAPAYQKNAKPAKPGKPSGADRTAQADFRKAASWIKSLDDSTAKTTKDPAKRRQIVQEILLKGDQVSGIPSISGVGLDAALDVYYSKSLSPETVTALHNAGVKVKFLPGAPKTATSQSYDARIRRNEVDGPPVPRTR